MKRKIILDCDPGHDDAIAILLALSSDELEVLGITTVYGNVGLPFTSRNARIMVELAGKTTKVFAGANRPLLRDRISAEDVHGKSGLEGPVFDEPKQPLEQQHAVQFIIDSILEHPNQVTLVPVGAFTNIALAMRLAPEIIPLIPEIVLMGGSTTLGNTSPAAEFNIFCDPHAASIVFSSGVKLTMFGLNLTHQCLATPDRVAKFYALGTKVGTVTAQLLEFFKLSYNKRYGFAGPALHDPCTIAYLIQPELFSVQAMHVEVDVIPGPSFGRTVCDVWDVTRKPANCDVAMTANADGFFDLLVERLGTLG
jgi:purine nucleosidase